MFQVFVSFTLFAFDTKCWYTSSSEHRHFILLANSLYLTVALSHSRNKRRMRRVELHENTDIEKCSIIYHCFFGNICIFIEVKSQTE